MMTPQPTKDNDMKMTQQPTRMVYDPVADDMTEVTNTDHSNSQGNCDRCDTLILRFRGQGDLTCPSCGAHYNCCGQRLRDDLRTRVNPSEHDDDIGDLEGDELSYLAHERG